VTIAPGGSARLSVRISRTIPIDAVPVPIDLQIRATNGIKTREATFELTIDTNAN
jgi:hypothetical protein